MIDAINIKILDKSGVLGKITDCIDKNNANIIHTHLYLESKDYGYIFIELNKVENLDDLIIQIENIEEVVQVNKSQSMDEVWGKRVIIMGNDRKLSQVAIGAITEADRHNLRGERISVDTIPIEDEDNFVEAIKALGSLPRVGVLVLASPLMNDKFVSLIKSLQVNCKVKVISVNIFDSIYNYADLIVKDPVQAGVMAVMSIANTSKFDISRLKKVL